MDKTAIIILNWNGCEMLRRFLPSVVGYSKSDATAIYVADNASTDDSVAMLRRDFPEVRLVLLDKNYGFAEGYNRALQQVQAEYVILLNSDVEVTEDWLAPLITYMDAHPEVAACQPKLRSYHHRDSFEYAGAAGGFIDSYGYPFCRGRVMSRVEKDHGQYDTVANIFWATGAALCIRHHDYCEAGGLDGDFFAHMEEIDLCWRLRSRGRKIVCVPQSVVYHVGAATLKRESPRKTYLNFRNNLLMLYKNLPVAELRRVMRVRACLDMLAALSFLLKGQPANAWAVCKARRAYNRMRYDYLSSRSDNLKKATVLIIPERLPGCLLTQFYLWRKKRFSSLKWF